MKIAILITRILLGLVFFASGLTSILHLFKLKPDPANDATTFLTLLTTHNYMTFIALLMLVAGLLLLVGRFVPLGLVILGPILVNILLFHILFHAPGSITGVICTVFEIFLIWAYRFSFRGLFDAAPEVS
jgi:uncharacterized membrane protein YphA (DoxX/SURF4 family)